MKNGLGASERRFAEIIWREAPLSSGELSDLARKELDWKKTTSYTVLKRLEEKGLFKNEKGTVSVVTPRDEYLKKESRSYVEEAFGGSLPAFITAFTAEESLTKEEALELRRLIDRAKESCRA